MMYHHTKFEVPNAFHKNYMNIQICIMSTSMSINIVHLFRQLNPKMPKFKFDKIRHKMEIMFIYLPNISRFIYFQSVRQKKWNIHYKTIKYRWRFRSKPQTMSLSTYRMIHISSMGHNRGQVSDSLSDKCTALIQNNL